MILYIGVDASKGYSDFCFLEQSGKVLEQFQQDDTKAGHDFAKERIFHYLDLGYTKCLIGIESSGGVEKNWLQSFRKWSVAQSIKALHLNPLLVKNHRERKLHHSVTDSYSAKIIADLLRYLPEGSGEVEIEPGLDEARRLEQHLSGLIEQCGAMKTELQGILVTSHPELVQYTRDNFSNWILEILKKYPTNKALTESSPEELSKVPYLSLPRATQIWKSAKESVSSTQGPMTALLVESTVNQIMSLTAAIKRIQDKLESFFEKDKTVAILKSMPGFGTRTAILLRLYYGDFTNFHSEAAVVAYAGLDPSYHHSGDGEFHFKIIRKGHARIRAALYMPALAVLRCDSRLKTFHDRLIERGKHSKSARTAVMAKLLRISYACVLKGQFYDPGYSIAEQKKTSGPATVSKQSTDATAPVSWREAKKRKQRAAAAANEIKSQEKRSLATASSS